MSLISRYSKLLRPCIAGVLLALAAAAPARAWDATEEWGDVLTAVTRRHDTFPVLSSYGAQFDLPTAYRLQRRLVQANYPPADIAGFRAALVNRLAQYKYRAPEPLSAVVPRAGRIPRDRDVNLADYQQAIMSVELAIVLDKAVSLPLPDSSKIPALVRAAMPAIVITDQRFEPGPPPIASDLVAANLGATTYILGRPLDDKQHAALNEVLVELSRNGDVVDRGKGRNVMDDQYEALLWLINKLVGQGWTLQPGQILFTGAMGDLVPVKPGEYVAHFRDVEDIRFLVTFAVKKK